MPFNRRSLVMHGLAKLATVHTLSPVVDKARADKYNGLLDANTRDFVAALYPATSRGYPTYTWYYANTPPAGTVEMVRGMHGYLDVWGLFIAWQHGSAPEALTDNVMQSTSLSDVRTVDRSLTWMGSSGEHDDASDLQQ